MSSGALSATLPFLPLDMVQFYQESPRHSQTLRPLPHRPHATFAARGAGAILAGVTIMERVNVSVPATTANLGPGFDCLGMALDIWNSVEVDAGASGFDVIGEGSDTLPRGEANLIHKSFRLPFEEAGRPVPQVHITCRNKIPLGRGLGSSSAAVVGGLVAGNEMCGRPLTQERLLELATLTEGHPDNAAPALLGGCQIVVRDEDRLIATSVPVPENLRAVLFVPDQAMPTDEARGLLPENIARRDAVYNIGRVAMLVKALATGDFTYLRVATQDRLHQPARQKLFPAMKNIFAAAQGAGALGVFLSGAGSSVLALTLEKEMTIGYEMANAAAKSGVGGEVKVTRPTQHGVHVDSR